MSDSGENENENKPMTKLQKILGIGAAAAAAAALYIINNKDQVGAGKKSTKGPQIEVKLAPGETLGDLIVKYVGDYNTYNINQVKKLNKGKIKNLNLLQPGQTLKLPDNRKGVYEPAGAAPGGKSPFAMKSGGGEGGGGGGAPEGRDSRNNPWSDPLEDQNGGRKRSKGKVRLLQDDW